MRWIVMLCLCVLGMNLQALDVIPTPSEVVESSERITLPKTVTVAVAKNLSHGSVAALVDVLNKHGTRGVKLSTDGAVGDIVLKKMTVDSYNLGEEGYRMVIAKGTPCITVEAMTDTGIFYAVKTLQQLLALEKGSLPVVTIVDRPRSTWRAFMIDSGRQYQKLATLKGLLDMMAELKMNVFHWHLTEGTGWRIEIKKYPKLTSVGAFVGKGEEQYGFYTQDEIREIVRYAAARHIVVMPEIDVPGHSEAALTAYPEYTCAGKAPVIGGRNFNFSDVIFCAGRDTTYTFLKDVFSEVMDLFPGAYVHLGGDEAPKGQWKKCACCNAKMKALGLKDMEQLQAHFMSELIRFLGARGKTAVVYNDAIAGDPTRLPSNLLIQWWNYNATGDKGLKDAVKGGLKVVAATNKYCYINFPIKPWQGYNANRNSNARLTYEKNPSYNTKNPVIIGMTASLWTDYNLTERLLPRRLYPRIYILAEQMWSTTEPIPFDDFYKRINDKYYPLLKAKGITPGYGFPEEMPEDYNDG